MQATRGEVGGGRAGAERNVISIFGSKTDAEAESQRYTTVIRDDVAIEDRLYIKRARDNVKYIGQAFVAKYDDAELTADGSSADVHAELLDLKTRYNALVKALLDMGILAGGLSS